MTFDEIENSVKLLNNRSRFNIDAQKLIPFLNLL